MNLLGLLTKQLEWNTIVDKDLQHSVVTFSYLHSDAPKSGLSVVFLVSNEHITPLPIANKWTQFIYCLCNCGSYTLIGQYDYYGRFCWMYVLVEGIFFTPQGFIWWCLVFLFFGFFKTAYRSLEYYQGIFPRMLKLINIIRKRLHSLNYAIMWSY